MHETAILHIELLYELLTTKSQLVLVQYAERAPAACAPLCITTANDILKVGAQIYDLQLPCGTCALQGHTC